MAILKCKMCGGDLLVTEGVSTCECEYCGSLQTVPNADDEKKLASFVRANNARAACEFDKASGIYENIVAEFPEEAEAYWGLLLCQYGIEYVDDPASDKKIPTCHRSSFDSIFDDDNFELVMEYADITAREVYRKEAKEIEKLRNNILEFSSKEEPYDIFICYKETDQNGDRTPDSLMAQNVYDALTEKGYRVFFSRITLESALGETYEPIIFAALNSAKIMLAFGTSYEYYNAVWVKNEWSRFLKLITKDNKKVLIPCYKDIDAYDMPKEFRSLQGQDMGKVGAIQDLLRGVEKIIPKNEPAPVVSVTPQTATTESLLKRAMMYIEDGNWSSADDYCEKVLDIDPENANAYLAKLLVELKVDKRENLINCEEPFEEMPTCQKLIRFAEDSLKNEILKINTEIRERNALADAMALYNRALQLKDEASKSIDILNASKTYENYNEFKSNFQSLFAVLNRLPEDFQDTAKLSELSNELFKSVCYNVGFDWLSKADAEILSVKTKYAFIEEYSGYAITAFKDMGDYRNYEELLEKANAIHKESLYYKACNECVENPNVCEISFEDLGEYKFSKRNANLCKQLDALTTKNKNSKQKIEQAETQINNAHNRMGDKPQGARISLLHFILFTGLFLATIFITTYCFTVAKFGTGVLLYLGGIAGLTIYGYKLRTEHLDCSPVGTIFLWIFVIFWIVLPIQLFKEFLDWNYGLGKEKKIIKNNKAIISQQTESIKANQKQIDEIYNIIMN